MRDTDQFLADLQRGLDAATTPGEELSSLFAAIGADAKRAADEHMVELQHDIDYPDPNPAAFPLDGYPTLIRAVAHAIALSGYSADDLDDFFQVPAGQTAAALTDPNVGMTQVFQNVTEFIFYSRAVTLTYPGRPVRDWWETPGHGKRLSPRDIARSNRIRDRIFDPYRQELHCNGQACPQLLPLMGEGTYRDLSI